MDSNKRLKRTTNRRPAEYAPEQVEDNDEVTIDWGCFNLWKEF